MCDFLSICWCKCSVGGDFDIVVSRDDVTLNMTGYEEDNNETVINRLRPVESEITQLNSTSKKKKNV